MLKIKNSNQNNWTFKWYCYFCRDVQVKCDIIITGKETTVKSTTFVVKQIEDETEKILREFSIERNYKIANVVLIGVGLAYLVTFVLIFYQLCCKQRHEDEEIVPSMKYTS